MTRGGAEPALASCGLAIIVAHKEDTRQLRDELIAQGFAVQEVRGPYTEEQLGYAYNIRCMINHGNAWRLAAERDRPTVIVEADFVPVCGLGARPLPFPHSDRPRFGWLYSAGSILYGFDAGGWPHGHGNTMVAYVLDPAAASALEAFLARELQGPSPGEYRLWDTYLGIFLRWEKSILNHIPTYQYGEHGGVANREHARGGARAWHEADLLAGPLAFLPPYARGSWLIYRARRLRGWLRGLYRVLTLRYYDPRYVNADTSVGRLGMAIYVLARILKLAPLRVAGRRRR